jgi:hypothetical protein
MTLLLFGMTPHNELLLLMVEIIIASRFQKQASAIHPRKRANEVLGELPQPFRRITKVVLNQFNNPRNKIGFSRGTRVL